MAQGGLVMWSLEISLPGMDGEGSGRQKMTTIVFFVREQRYWFILAARARVALGKRKNSE